MATQDPPLSAGYRWRFGMTIAFLVLSIPAAAMTGSIVGSQLMSGLKDQVVAPLDGGEDQQTAFSPYGIAHTGSGAPGKFALSDPDDEGDTPPDSDPESAPASGDVLQEAPVITVEPLITPHEVVPPGDPTAVDEAESQAPTDPNSIFSMDEPAAKRPKQYRIVLGTFGDPANADALVQDLLKDGYEPFVETKEPAESESAVQYRVLIGTFNDAADAGAVAEELRRLGYNAWLNTKS